MQAIKGLGGELHCIVAKEHGPATHAAHLAELGFLVDLNQLLRHSVLMQQHLPCSPLRFVCKKTIGKHLVYHSVTLVSNSTLASQRPSLLEGS